MTFMIQDRVSPEAVFCCIHRNGFRPGQLSKMRITENFSWAEVFTNRTSDDIIATPESVFDSALRQAERLESVRNFLREKLTPRAIIQVTSWVRSPSSNANMGGAKQSQHLRGNATDFIVPGYESVTGNRKVQALLCTQKDSIGFCLEITRGAWTHIDGRPSHLVFENQGKGQYSVWSLPQMTAFARAYAVPSDSGESV
ncbi:MAG: DUF882 domain-containing protein [Cyanobacteria bacterium]|nr:DUF882 domain-containing protein [Cyanobacteriota bacterium]